MKIVGFIVVGRGEADRYLFQVLKRIKPLVNEIAVLANNVDKKTLSLLKKFNCVIYFDNQEWGKKQHIIKQNFYNKIAELNPDWILALDADEIFDERLTRKDLEEMANNELYDSYSFYFVQLWDNGYNPSLGFWNVRFYKYLSGEWTNKPLHSGLAPMWAYKTTWYAPFIIIHYGLKNKNSREAKIARYKKYDPMAKYLSKWFYEQLRIGKAEKLDIKKITNEVVKEVSSYQQRKQKLMDIKNKEKKFYYFKRKIDGMILDIPERNYEEMLKKTDEFELIDKKPVTAGKIVRDENIDIAVEKKEEIEKPLFICNICGFVAESEEELKEHKKTHGEEKAKETKKEEFICDICGFKAKSKLGLMAHKRIHNKKNIN